MKMIALLLWILLLAMPLIMHGQDSIRPVVFTDKYWGFVYNEAKSYQQQYDTMFLIRQNEKKDLFKNGPLKGGVIFRSDGSFESFNYVKCGFDSKGRKGIWALDKNVIIVQFEDHIQWYFRIKYVNGTHYVLRCCMF